MTVADLDVPSGFDGTPAVLKLHGIGFGQMGFGVALHVNCAELDVGMREEAFEDRFETGKVIMNNQHDATQATFTEAADQDLPAFGVFTAGLRQTGQDALLAVLFGNA